MAPGSKLGMGAEQRYVHRAHNLLRSGIRTGRISQGAVLDEASLSRQLGTSRNAIREALQLLAHEGLVSRERGRGTRVTGSITSAPIDHLWSIEFEHSMQTYDVESIPIERGVVRLGDGSGNMLLDAGLLERCEPQMFLVEHLVRTGGAAIALRSIYMPLEPDPELIADCVDRLPDVYELAYGTRLTSIVCTVHAVPCDHRTGSLLNVSEGAPVLLREISFRDADGHARLVTFQVYRADKVSLQHVTTFDIGPDDAAGDVAVDAPSP